METARPAHQALDTAAWYAEMPTIARAFSGHVRERAAAAVPTRRGDEERFPETPWMDPTTRVAVV